MPQVCVVSHDVIVQHQLTRLLLVGSSNLLLTISSKYRGSQNTITNGRDRPTCVYIISCFPPNPPLLSSSAFPQISMPSLRFVLLSPSKVPGLGRQHMSASIRRSRGYQVPHLPFVDNPSRNAVYLSRPHPSSTSLLLLLPPPTSSRVEAWRSQIVNAPSLPFPSPPSSPAQLPSSPTISSIGSSASPGRIRRKMGLVLDEFLKASPDIVFDTFWLERFFSAGVDVPERNLPPAHRETCISESECSLASSSEDSQDSGASNSTDDVFAQSQAVATVSVVDDSDVSHDSAGFTLYCGSPSQYTDSSSNGSSSLLPLPSPCRAFKLDAEATVQGSLPPYPQVDEPLTCSTDPYLFDSFLSNRSSIPQYLRSHSPSTPSSIPSVSPAPRSRSPSLESASILEASASSASLPSEDLEPVEPTFDEDREPVEPSFSFRPGWMSQAFPELAGPRGPYLPDTPRRIRNSRFKSANPKFQRYVAPVSADSEQNPLPSPPSRGLLELDMEPEATTPIPGALYLAPRVQPSLQDPEPDWMDNAFVDDSILDQDEDEEAKLDIPGAYPDLPEENEQLSGRTQGWLGLAATVAVAAAVAMVMWW